MASGDSDVSICSRAVQRVGGQAFTAFTDNVAGAALCGEIYPGIRDSVLGEHDWHFLTKKLQLSREATPPISKWTYQFTLPPDRIQDAPVQVFASADPGALAITEGWVILGNKLMTDIEAIWADYGGTTNEGLWPGYFTEVMISIMMMEMKRSITGKDATENQIVRTSDKLQRAKTRNAQDHPPKTFEDFSLIEARLGGL